MLSDSFSYLFLILIFEEFVWSNHWTPYFFLDISKYGWAVAVFIVAFLVVFSIVLLLMLLFKALVNRYVFGYSSVKSKTD